MRRTGGGANGSTRRKGGEVRNGRVLGGGSGESHRHPGGAVIEPGGQSRGKNHSRKRVPGTLSNKKAGSVKRVEMKGENIRQAGSATAKLNNSSRMKSKRSLKNQVSVENDLCAKIGFGR